MSNISRLDLLQGSQYCQCKNNQMSSALCIEAARGEGDLVWPFLDPHYFTLIEA